LDALVKLGVCAQDVAALALIPLVYVAWADGSVNKKEREAILDAAAQQGIKTDSRTYELLESWLDRDPKGALFDCWKDYVGALVPHLDDAKLQSIEESILGLAHDVASAAGGILGLAAISKREEAALNDIRSAFAR
jgi:hypothetical protein